MASRYDHETGNKWKVTNVRNMTDFKGAGFEITIDKGIFEGLDAMISGSLWDLPQELRKNTGDHIDEVLATLD
ncbi:hypothetical protein MMC12_008330 [Toensbergia leucococca]|nr:hypothetical protein [Toensbergia leucococca]